jgi:hypothetical protein
MSDPSEAAIEAAREECRRRGMGTSDDIREVLRAAYAVDHVAAPPPSDELRAAIIDVIATLTACHPGAIPPALRESVNALETAALRAARGSRPTHGGDAPDGPWRAVAELAHQHLDTFGVMSGGSPREHESQARFFKAYRLAAEPAKGA